MDIFTCKPSTSESLLLEAIAGWLERRTAAEKAALRAFFHLAEPRLAADVRFRITVAGDLSLILRTPVHSSRRAPARWRIEARDDG